MDEFIAADELSARQLDEFPDDVAAEPAALPKWPLGTCMPIDGKTLAAAVQRSRPAVKMFVPQQFCAGLFFTSLMSRNIADSGSQGSARRFVVDDRCAYQVQVGPTAVEVVVSQEGGTCREGS
jgi:hypothetical protein